MIAERGESENANERTLTSDWLATVNDARLGKLEKSECTTWEKSCVSVMFPRIRVDTEQSRVHKQSESNLWLVDFQYPLRCFEWWKESAEMRGLSITEKGNKDLLQVRMGIPGPNRQPQTYSASEHLLSRSNQDELLFNWIDCKFVPEEGWKWTRFRLESAVSSNRRREASAPCSAVILQRL